MELPASRSEPAWGAETLDPYTDRTILVVEDDDDFAAQVMQLLGRLFPTVRVFRASSAGEALEVLRRDSVDVVVSDQRMPGMTGLELLRRLRREWPSVSALLMTGHPDLALASAAVEEAEVESFVAKPFDPESFAGLVAAILLERAARRLRQRSTLRGLVRHPAEDT